MPATQSLDSMKEVLTEYLAERPIEKRELGSQQDWRPHDPRDGFYWHLWEYRKPQETWCKHIVVGINGWSINSIGVPCLWMFCPICGAKRPE